MSMQSGMSRRGFIQAGAALSAALAMNVHGAQETPPVKTVRVGMVGVGSRGTFLTNTLLQLPGVEIPAVCDINPDHAARAKDIVEKAMGKAPELYTQGERDWERLVARDDLDAVITATPWQWHTPVMVAAMKAGKYGGTEVPAALTVEECWDLVRTSEETGKPCMMLENVCYFENALAILRMVREGVFGELIHAEAGYQHDGRFVMISGKGDLLWRGEHAIKSNGNLYPTHPIGPVAQWMNINRGDRFTRLVSMSAKSRGLNYYAAKKFGPDHPLAKQRFALGDLNTTLLETENGCTVTLYFDLGTPRPYDLIFRLQGTRGICMGAWDKIYLEDVSPQKEQWEPFAPYMQKYMHPIWKDLNAGSIQSGHGGGDYITVHQFIQAVRNNTQTPQDVYDAAAWSVIVPLSIQSATAHGDPMEFPDFTAGKWKTNPPIEIKGVSV
ncbi:MAG TPA: Gfo/Idh/MocA family oxidoreductase [Candidatus Hydrogenedentes bacterium]|nr:Gfo/Idh/MocA family oxidoreductase [Candidatus Hydrogenedentota bacterium]